MRDLTVAIYVSCWNPWWSLTSFGTLFPKCQVPDPIMQRFTQQLLLALDYAHQSCVIHTDIQPRNIMVQIPDFSVIDDYLRETPTDLAAYEPTSDSSTIVSQPLRDFYIRESSDLMTLNIALCDWGSASSTVDHLTDVIQPVLLRAPEVIIGAPWGPPVDIWNLGAVLLEVLDAVRMFDGRAAQTGGVYKTKHHIEEMVALFGPFPPRLLAQGNQILVAEYFDECGKIRNPTPRPKALLENWIESLTGDDKEEFIKLLTSMMKIDPDDRKTAKQLLDEPWLQHTGLHIQNISHMNQALAD
ncbi:kinase-like domain-containing protein [Lipomyces kononenkoae]